ncbi:MAG: acyl carrier protein [Myxococcota bacterium]|nr:acyl carrier protein [Myxococcota bacterium]
MHDQPALAQRVRDLIAERLGIERHQAQAEVSILEDLGADSLDVVEMVMALEQTFDLEVPDSDVEMMRTIGDVERYIESRIH